MAAKHLDKARDCVKKKNFEYAIHWFLTHLKGEPGDVEARKELRLAERAQKKVGGGGGLWGKAKAKARELQAMNIRVNAKDPEKTMIQCEELLKTDPDLVVALIRLGEAASYAKLDDVAVQAFTDALSVDKTSKEAMRLLGRTYRGTGQLKEALQCFQRLHKLDPGDKEAEDLIKNLPAQMTAAKVQEGVEKGGYQNLIDKDEAQKLERQSSRIRTPEQALERISELEEKLLEDETDTKTMRLIAELYVKAEQPDEALTWCDKALEIKADDYLVADLRGDLLMDRHEKMLKKYEAAYKKNSGDAQAKAKFAAAKKKKLAFDLEEYGRRVEAHPTELGLRFDFGKVLYDANKIDEAIKEFQQAKTDSRKKSEAGYYLARCFIAKKIYKLAVRELEGARADLFEMTELKKEITYYLARIYEQANKKDKAISEYEQIAEVDFSYRDVTSRLEGLSEL
jgi:tetratricopeptide (TPR) repeat protein